MMASREDDLVPRTPEEDLQHLTDPRFVIDDQEPQR
jgi:hypothetical protein